MALIVPIVPITKKTMKKIIYLLALLLLPLTTQAQKYDFANYQRFAHEDSLLGKPTKGEKRVVFLGNSITEGWIRKHKEFFDAHHYINRGISGQTTYQYLLRLRQDVLDLEPRVLVFNYGTNDIAENTGVYNEDRTFGNILSIVEQAQAHGIRVILCSCLPASKFGWRPTITGAMEKIRSLNARVQAYAMQHKIAYVDFFTPMLNADGTGMNSAYTPETVHPNVEGYKVMEALVVPAINKALRK